VERYLKGTLERQLHNHAAEVFQEVCFKCLRTPRWRLPGGALDIDYTELDF
jgi:hypothetical protein